MSDVVCARCSKSEVEILRSLKRCAACQKTHYCSTDCQKADWPQHKRYCSKVKNSPKTVPPLRATCRISSGHASFPRNETLYYIRKSIPHLDDITMAGPFYPLNSIVEQIKHNLHQLSPGGIPLISELAEDEDRLAGLVHLRSPLKSDPSNYVLIESLPQHNPVMSARLPGPTYSVIQSSLLVDPQEKAEREARYGRSPHPRLEAMEVHGCYEDLHAANTMAEAVAQAIKEDLVVVDPRSQNRARSGQPSEIIVIGNDESDQPRAHAIEVRFDNGRTRNV